MPLLQKLWRWIMPAHIRHYIFLLRTHFKVIELETGNFRSAREGMAVDQQGRPLPWYTYPMIDYLNQLDFSEKSVFEFGAGNSTLYWARRAKSVTSIEHDVKWYDVVR